MPTYKLSLTALLLPFLLTAPHCSASRLTPAGTTPIGDLSLADRTTSPSFEVQCVCASRVGGCLPDVDNCGITAQDCEQGCACSADGVGYSCAATKACSAGRMDGVCGATSPEHLTDRGMRCSCVPAAPAPTAL